MRKPTTWSLIVVLSVALLASVPTAYAGSPVDVDVQVGGSFSGTVAGVGSEFNARFYAAEGAALVLKVKAASNSTLKPTAVVRAEFGSVIAGQTQQIAWVPSGNLVHYVTAPAAGMYLATIGSSAGDGGFTASISGNSEIPIVLATLSGVVTDDDSGGLISGATVLVDGAPFDTTNASGAYSGELEPGDYDVTFQAAGYEERIESIAMTSMDRTLNVSLTPIVPASVTAGLTGDPEFDGDVTGTVDISTQPGVNVISVEWALLRGPAQTMLVPGPGDDVTVTLGGVADYKDYLIHVLSEPPIGEDDLPPNVPLPDGEFPGGLQDRLQVVGINPFALEEAGLVVLEVTVTTDAGVFKDQVEIHTNLPWAVATGLRNVPIAVPVLLHAVSAGSYDWSLVEQPGGSLAMLTDAQTQTPYFTPDVPGLYEFEIVSAPLAAQGVVEPETLQVYAGTWRGVIVDQNMDGTPVSDTACTTCHSGEPILPGGDPVADNFTPWEKTGHAEIFSSQLDTGTHVSANCFSCHMTGYNPAAENDGADDAPDYAAFLTAGLLNHPGDNWTTMLEDFPDTARLSNVQCENCHGPQMSDGHGFGGPLGEPRVSLSANVCGTCHGEPARHARFQQWQLSAHANYELAEEESQSGSCSRCHTSNGFLTWLPVLLDDDPGTDPLNDIFGCTSGTCYGPLEGKACSSNSQCAPWTAEEAHPQTCVTCHDPHNAGTTSGNNPDVNIRVSDDTPPLIAGFTAHDVGRGAMCMTCHNSRRGLRNDAVWGGFSVSTKAQAPHGSAQTDVLMGQNAYLVAVGTPGGHGETEHTCVDCHMKATPPPDLLSYNSNGANHTFYAELTICSECHSPNLKASDVQNGIRQLMNQVEDLIVDRYYEIMEQQIGAGNTIDFNGSVVLIDIGDLTINAVGESRGSQAIDVSIDGTDYGLFRITDIDIVDGDAMTSDPTLAAVTDDTTLKAGWNLSLFTNDGSTGIHNPFFANGTLITTRNALIALSPATVETPIADDATPFDRIERRPDRSERRSAIGQRQR